MSYIIHREALEKLYENLDHFIEEYDGSKIVVMFGTNKIAGMIIHYLRIHGIEVQAIIDNDKQRQGKKFDGIPVYEPGAYIRKRSKQVLVLIASAHQLSMIKQLEQLGCVNEKNIKKIIDLPKLMNSYDFAKHDNCRKMTRDEIRETQIGILKYLKKVCEENGLRYYLCGGTLLGAARHQGYIPWDDDIDVFVELNDLIKLHKILEQDNRYRLISMFDDSGYFDECSLLVDMDTVCDINRFPMQVTSGVSIDVFMISGLPDGQEAIKVMDQAKQLELACYNTLYSKKENKEAVKKLIAYMQQYDFDQCPNVAHVLGRFMYREITKKEYFEKSVLLPFEGEQMACPVGWDAYLTDIYGDYMTLPPREQQVAHHYFRAYLKDR